MHFQTGVHKEIESNKTVPIISFFIYLANIVRTVYAIIICCICMYMYLSKFKTEVVFNTIIKDAFVCTYSKWSWPKVYVTYTLRISFQNCLLWLLFGGGILWNFRFTMHKMIYFVCHMVPCIFLPNSMPIFKVTYSAS